MYLVTGGAGFIGSNISAALSGISDGDVVICDRFESDHRWENLVRTEVRDLITPDRLFEFLGDHQGDLDAIIHLGAISATTERDVDRLIANNVRLTFDLWDWCVVNQTRFLYASSAATYGDGGQGFHDGELPSDLGRLRPLNAYGWSKQVVDQRFARARSNGESVPPQWVGLKFFNVYGPNEYHKGTMQSVVAKAFRTIQEGRVVELFRSHREGIADGGQTRDFIYVGDIVRVMHWLLSNPGVSGIYNVGTGVARSFSDLVHAVFRAMEEPARIAFIDMPTELRDKYQYFTEADMARLRSVGYREPFTSLEEGVRDYVQRFLSREDPHAGTADWKEYLLPTRARRAG